MLKCEKFFKKGQKMKLKFDPKNEMFRLRYIERNATGRLSFKMCKEAMLENPRFVPKILSLYFADKFNAKLRKFGEKLPFGKMRTSEISALFKNLFSRNCAQNLGENLRVNLGLNSAPNADKIANGGGEIAFVN